MPKKVYLDAGHGGNDAGAIGVNNAYEKNITLSVTLKVKALLEDHGIDVRLSRENDKYISLGYRTSDANKWNADCFVSIHCNAYNDVAQGLETFAYKSSTNNLATYIQDAILNTKSYTKNRGVKYASFYVLRNTNMRSALVELGFIDNKEDYSILVNKQNQLAEGIARGICKYLGIEFKTKSNPESDKPNVDDSDIFFRVVCGSFTERVNAEEQIENLKEKGIDSCFIAAYKKQ